MSSELGSYLARCVSLPRAGTTWWCSQAQAQASSPTTTTYEKAGARILPTAEAVFAEAEMIVKVKEPQAVEYRRLKPHQILFTYLHLAPDPEQARGLMAVGRHGHCL